MFLQIYEKNNGSYLYNNIPKILLVFLLRDTRIHNILFSLPGDNFVFFFKRVAITNERNTHAGMIFRIIYMYNHSVTHHEICQARTK